MLSMRTMMQETIEKLDAIAIITCDILQLLWSFRVISLQWFKPLGLHPIRWALIQNFNFIKSSLQILRCTSLNFDSYIGIIFDIFSQPNCGEMAPTQFLNYDISIYHYLTNMHTMITAHLVIRHTFILRWVRIFVKWITQFIFQWSILQIIRSLFIFFG